MKCEHCGYEAEQAYAFCPQCGEVTQNNVTEVAAAQPVNTAAQKVLQALKDPLFFALCILMSICCATQLIQSSPDVLTILFTVFLWLTYAQARKDIVSANYLRCISGTVYAQYILTNVAAIMVIVIGGILGMAFGALVNNTSIINEILSSIEVASLDVTTLQEVLGSVSGAVIFVVFALIGGLMLVINLVSVRRIHRFTKSVYQGVESGELEQKYARSSYTWLYVFGIFSGIGLLGNMSGGDLILLLCKLSYGRC